MLVGSLDYGRVDMQWIRYLLRDANVAIFGYERVQLAWDVDVHFVQVRGLVDKGLVNEKFIETQRTSRRGCLMWGDGGWELGLG